VSPADRPDPRHRVLGIALQLAAYPPTRKHEACLRGARALAAHHRASRRAGRRRGGLARSARDAQEAEPVDLRPALGTAAREGGGFSFDARERPSIARPMLVGSARPMGAGEIEQVEVLMAEGVYKIVEVVGVSEQSWEDAGRKAVETAAGSLRDLRVAEVTKLDMKVEDGKVAAFRTRVSLSFKYEA
jgi:dodecin